VHGGALVTGRRDCPDEPHAEHCHEDTCGHMAGDCICSCDDCKTADACPCDECAHGRDEADEWSAREASEGHRDIDEDREVWS
jgi:hypothetical protein